nr:putative ankyrin repeat protein [Megavirus caiporensis]
MEKKSFFKIIKDSENLKNFKKCINCTTNNFKTNDFKNNDWDINKNFDFCELFVLYEILFANKCKYLCEIILPDIVTIIDHSKGKYSASNIILKKIYRMDKPKIIESVILDNICMDNDENNKNLLFLASSRGYYNVVKLLIENGIDIHIDNDFPVRLASNHRYLDIVGLLIENGANINARDGYALRLATCKGFYDVVKYLVENGANPYMYVGRDSNALKIACKKGHYEIFEYLINKMDNTRVDKKNLLIIACNKRYLNIVRYLVKNGTDVNANNDALKIAQKRGYLEIVDFLIENGAQIDI